MFQISSWRNLFLAALRNIIALIIIEIIAHFRVFVYCNKVFISFGLRFFCKAISYSFRYTSCSARSLAPCVLNDWLLISCRGRLQFCLSSICCPIIYLWLIADIKSLASSTVSSRSWRSEERIRLYQLIVVYIYWRSYIIFFLFLERKTTTLWI